MSKSNLATVEEFYTDEEYIALECEAQEKHELFNGKIIATATSNRNHCLINGNTSGAIHSQLKTSSFEVYSSNMRVRMKEGNYSYPDVVVVYDEPQFVDGEFDTLLNL